MRSILFFLLKYFHKRDRPPPPRPRRRIIIDLKPLKWYGRHGANAWPGTTPVRTQPGAALRTYSKTELKWSLAT